MLISLATLLTNLFSIFRSRAALELENLALRHQIGVVGRQNFNRDQNEIVLGREGLNTILASTQREDFGGQEPVWAYSTHTY